MFAAGFSMPLARVCVVISFALLVLRRRGKTTEAGGRFMSAPFVGFLVYFAVALVVSAIAVATNTDELLDPRRGFGKLYKLLWYAFIPLGTLQINSPERAKTALKTFVYGCLVTALTVVFYNPLAAWFQVTVPHPKLPEWALTPTQIALRRIVDFFGSSAIVHVFDWIRHNYQARTFGAALAKLGTMSDSQRLMVALPAALGLAFFCDVSCEKKRRKIVRFALPAVIFMALALTLKRGPLMFGVAASAALFVRRLGWKSFLIPLAAVSVVALIPAARERFSRLPNEFAVAEGGRAAMWMKIAPELRREHPFGIGFRALTNEKMRAIAPQAEARQTHLHSSPLQSTVDFGWLGFVAWALWMTLALLAAWRCPHPAPFCMLAAIIGYGFMEYNIADAEVILLYSFSMALAATGFGTFSLPRSRAEDIRGRCGFRGNRFRRGGGSRG